MVTAQQFEELGVWQDSREIVAQRPSRTEAMTPKPATFNFQPAPQKHEH